MIQKTLHETYCKSGNKLNDWYCGQVGMVPYPIFSSYDIRDSGHKVAPVDANIFPAGFNNICSTDVDHASGLFDRYIKAHYARDIRSIMLVTEEHTQNPYYWDNVGTLLDILTATGRQVTVAFPKHLDAPVEVSNTIQRKFIVESGDIEKLRPDLIISNNDFSIFNPDWKIPWNTPVNPPRELGWYQRKKSTHFEKYNEVAREFAEVAGLDPAHFTVRTELFAHFDLEDEEATAALAARADQIIAELKIEYANKKFGGEPFLFMKNNAGTYGLAVIRVGSGADILELSYRNRKKMKAAKGGRAVSEVILQEGISSNVQHQGATAEPVIYMVGKDLGGGFLRAHPEKSDSESLNATGAIYKKLCVSDLLIGQADFPLENVYGWAARIGLVAIAREALAMNVTFPQYKTEMTPDQKLAKC